jgi:hypothetical protein
MAGKPRSMGGRQSRSRRRRNRLVYRNSGCLGTILMWSLFIGNMYVLWEK